MPINLMVPEIFTKPKLCTFVCHVHVDGWIGICLMLKWRGPCLLRVFFQLTLLLINALESLSLSHLLSHTLSLSISLSLSIYLSISPLSPLPPLSLHFNSQLTAVAGVLLTLR